MNINSLFADIFQYIDWINEAKDLATIEMLTSHANILLNFLFYFIQYGK
jgi:hypothetical protein